MTEEREARFARYLGVALLIAIGLAPLPFAALASRAEAQSQNNRLKLTQRQVVQRGSWRICST